MFEQISNAFNLNLEDEEQMSNVIKAKVESLRQLIKKYEELKCKLDQLEWFALKDEENSWELLHYAIEYVQDYNSLHAIIEQRKRHFYEFMADMNDIEEAFKTFTSKDSVLFESVSTG